MLYLSIFDIQMEFIYLHLGPQEERKLKRRISSGHYEHVTSKARLQKSRPGSYPNLQMTPPNTIAAAHQLKLTVMESGDAVKVTDVFS